MGLNGLNVLITGACGGIGAALCTTFAGAGADITAADVMAVPPTGLPAAHYLPFDATDTAAVNEQLGNLFAAGRVPDILVNNAGYTRGELLGQVDQDVWERELAINLTGCFNVTRPVLRAMTARGYGAIVFVASVNALGYYGNPAYSAAKAGMVAYSRSIAVECGKHAIRSNVVCPGSVRTPAWDHRIAQDPDILAKASAHYPLGRFVSPQEVAWAVAFLASPLASGITGSVLTVDAGLSAGNLSFVRDLFEVGQE